MFNLIKITAFSYSTYAGFNEQKLFPKICHFSKNDDKSVHQAVHFLIKNS